VRSLPALVATLACVLPTGCHVAAARAWNLNELHDESTHHRYTGALESDMEYFFRHEITGAISIGGAHFEQKAPVAIPDPTTACLENLLVLESYGDSDPRVAGMQVEWTTRLATADPWRLTRERAVIGLGRAGARLAVGVPAGLPEGSVPAGPDALSEALAGLLRASRPVMDRGNRATATERLDLDAACQVVLGLTLDLEGARRMVHATADLVEAVGSSVGPGQAGAPLKLLSLELQKRCVRFALAAALKDPEPLVRAAAVEAAVVCVGPGILDLILAQLSHELAPEVLVRTMDVVRKVGLPVGSPLGAPEESKVTPEQAQRARLAAIYDLLDRPEEAVRVSAMRALEKVSGAGLQSLREEDWQAWWVSLQEKRGP
jgi:hypothetical protein